MGLKVKPLGYEASCDMCGKRLLNVAGSLHFSSLGQLAQQVIDLFWQESEDELEDKLTCPECQLLLESQQGLVRDL